MSADLAVWLLERIAEDEAHANKDLWAARNAASGPWTARYGFNLGASWLETDAGPIAKFDGLSHQADVLLAARFKPSTVERRARERLAECDAKRRIIAAYLPPGADPHPGLPCINYEGQDLASYDEYDTCHRHLKASEKLIHHDYVLRLLALPYADRDGYREEWRPDA